MCCITSWHADTNKEPIHLSACMVMQYMTLYIHPVMHKEIRNMKITAHIELYCEGVICFCSDSNIFNSIAL